MLAEGVQVLLGDTYSRKLLGCILPLGWGRMFASPRLPRPFPGEPWGLDNGAFTCWRKGLPFDEVWFQRRVDHAVDHLHPPYLAVLPDIVTGADRSLEFSLSWRERLPCHYPWYLCVQDGMTESLVESALPSVEGLFLGGSDRFKATAPHWAAMAHRNGKRFHYGRAGTERKLRHAIASNCDSLDSAFPLWEQRRLDRFVEW